MCMCIAMLLNKAIRVLLSVLTTMLRHTALKYYAHVQDEDTGSEMVRDLPALRPQVSQDSNTSLQLLPKPVLPPVPPQYLLTSAYKNTNSVTVLLIQHRSICSQHNMNQTFKNYENVGHIYVNFEFRRPFTKFQEFF